MRTLTRHLLCGLTVFSFGIGLSACGDEDDTCPVDGHGDTPDTEVADDASDVLVLAPDMIETEVAAEVDAGSDVSTPECQEDDDCLVLLDPIGVCETAACTMGQCIRGALPDETVCDDDNACTENTACDKGACEGSAISCDDSDLCTTDSCNPASGCDNEFQANAPCDDGNDCTDDDTCFGGACFGSGNICPEICDNDMDDNGDGAADCLDPKCAADPVCNPECLIIDTLTCDDVIDVDLATAGGSQSVDQWGCSTGEFGGVERGWQFAVSGSVTATVTATNLPTGAAVMHLADPQVLGCLPALCSTLSTSDAGSAQVIFELDESQNHYVVLDTPPATTGTVQLAVTCAECAPTCNGKQCGGDGCGGICGVCGAGSKCSGGLCVVAPDNDECSDAAVIDPGQLPVIVAGTTAGATHHTALDPDSGCQGSNDLGFGFSAPDVAYAFTPSVDGDYIVAVEGSYNTSLYVVTSCSDVLGTCVGAQNVSGTGEVVTVTLAKDTKYTIVVDGFSGAGAGTFVLTVNHADCTAQCSGKSCGLDTCGGSCGTCSGSTTCTIVGNCVQPAPNETCDSATLVTNVPYSATQSTANANDDHFTLPEVCPGGQQGGLGGQGAGDLVYHLVPPSGGLYRATVTPNGNFDALLTVITGCPGSSQNCLAGSAEPGDATEVADFVVSEGEEVWLVVDGSTSDDFGQYTIEIEKLTCAPQCAGKSCGSDECGGSCGDCGNNSVCTASGACAVVPLNNQCSGAIVVDTLSAGSPYTYSGSTIGASADYSVPPTTCTPGPDAAEQGKGPDVVFEYTAPSAQNIRFFFTAPTDFVSYVYTMKTCGVPEEGCAAGTVTGSPGESEATAVLQSGQAIYIFVDGFGASDAGNYTFKAELF